MVNSVDLLGYVGAALTTIAFIPQITLAWRSDDLSGISLPMYLIFVTGVAFWLIYSRCAEGNIIFLNS